jgi:hypothetical protein
LDEYTIFGNIYNDFKRANPEFGNMLMQILDFDLRNSLKTILSTRYQIQQNQPEIRKTLKVKRKTGNGTMTFE